MTDCDLYLEDPETHAAHAQSCAECGVLAEAFGLPDVPPRPIQVDALPMAAWEGAKHRTWPLVIAGIVSIIRGSILWGIVLIVVGLLVGPGGVSIFD